ncbi:MAG: hypothetical protein WBD28_01985 [Candidatus Zixiibacteriota bacterium]
MMNTTGVFTCKASVNGKQFTFKKKVGADLPDPPDELEKRFFDL